ncbi:hypothetical protein VP01_11940g1, partial [Puccinia sorghi]
APVPQPLPILPQNVLAAPQVLKRLALPVMTETRQQETNLDRSTAEIIGSIRSQIRDEDCLAADGLNYAAWCDFIDERMRDAVNKPLFYHRTNYNSIHEHIGRQCNGQG